MAESEEEQKNLLMRVKEENERSGLKLNIKKNYDHGTSWQIEGEKVEAQIGEGNGNPFQRSCLEHPRDGGAWWAAVYGVAQGRT